MLDTSAVHLQTAISDNRPDLSFHEFLLINRDGKRGKSVRRGDAYLSTVENKFFCSKHFLSTDFQPSLTGHRRSLKPGAVPSVFRWKKVDDHEESLSRAKGLQARSSRQSRSEHPSE